MSAHFMDSHLNFRISSKDKKLIEVAKRDIIEMNQLNTIILNISDWEYFLAIVEEQPARINPNLKKAVKNYQRSFGD